MTFMRRKHQTDAPARAESTADMATDPQGRPRDHASAERAHARRVAPDPADRKHDHLDEREAENRQEALIDEALEESFPGSDPIAPKRIT